MKRLLLILTIFLLTGCTNVKKLDIKDSVTLFQNKIKHVNTYRVGYKYYLPQGMQVESNTLYNEIITNYKNKFYLFLDMVSYNYNTVNPIRYNKDNYYYSNFKKNDLFGYILVNEIDNKYLIEIMYNYAKIEVMVDSKDEISETIIYSINILNSVKYNDAVIKKLLDNELLNYSEQEYNIFNTKSEDSPYLNYDNTYIEETKDLIDQDLLKQEGN